MPPRCQSRPPQAAPSLGHGGHGAALATSLQRRARASAGQRSAGVKGPSFAACAGPCSGIHGAWRQAGCSSFASAGPNSHSVLVARPGMRLALLRLLRFQCRASRASPGRAPVRCDTKRLRARERWRARCGGAASAARSALSEPACAARRPCWCHRHGPGTPSPDCAIQRSVATDAERWA